MLSIKFFNLLAYTNIIISLGAVALTYLTVRLLQLPTDLLMFAIAFFITFFVYSFNRLTDIREDMINNPQRTEFFKKKTHMFITGGIIALILALFLSFLKSLQVFIIITLPAIFVIIYSVKWLPQKQKRLKEMFLVKNIVVSLGWFLIPIFVASYIGVFSIGILLIGLFIFLRIFIGVIMFDIRDVGGDRTHGIRTIPVVWNIKKSKKIIFILNILSAIVLIASIFLFNFPLILTSIITITALLFGIFYYFKINKMDMKFLCNVIVDSEYIFLGLISLLLYFFGI